MTQKLIITARTWQACQDPAEIRHRARQFRALGLCLLRALGRLPDGPLPTAVEAVRERGTVNGRPYWDWKLEDVCDMAEAALASRAKLG